VDPAVCYRRRRIEHGPGRHGFAPIVHHGTIMTTTDRKSPAQRARAAVRQLVPKSRRVKPLGGAKGRRLVQLRKLVSPLWKSNIIVTSRDGLRLELTDDPVDELVANDLLGRNRTLWFPAPPAGLAPVDDPRVVLDLGSHHGFYAVTALARYSRATLIAVEPSDVGVARVRRNLQLNRMEHRVRVVQAALASTAGSGTLFHTDEGSWGNSLFQEEGVTVLGRESVALLTLRDILQDAAPDVIKCNAEGAEFALVAQLSDCGLHPALMILMVHPEFGELAAIRSEVERMGYHVVMAGSENRPVLQAWRLGEPRPALD
jgi:FkbM family methyltransferase